MLEPIAGEKSTYQVSTERAPQQAGLNIVPLTATGDIITVKLDGLTDIDGSDWRACIVQRLKDGTCRYLKLFSDGDTCTATVESEVLKAHIFLLLQLRIMILIQKLVFLMELILNLQRINILLRVSSSIR